MLFSEINRRSANLHGIKIARDYLINRIGRENADIEILKIKPPIVRIDDDIILYGNNAKLFTVLNML